MNQIPFEITLIVKQEGVLLQALNCDRALPCQCWQTNPVEINRKKEKKNLIPFFKKSLMSAHSISISDEDVLKCIKSWEGWHQPDVKRGMKKKRENLEGQLFCSSGHHRRSEIEKNPPRSCSNSECTQKWEKIFWALIAPCRE